MSTTPEKSNPWYRQGTQWSWVAVATVLIISSIYLLKETITGRLLEVHLNAARSDLAASRVKNEDVRATVRTYDELIRQYDAQRDALIREIADFQREVEILSARTKRLELVGDKLAQLDREFQTFQTEKDGFNRAIQRLEARPKQDNGLAR